MEMPFEGVFFDIEYMDSYLNFEVDQKRFPNLKGLMQQLHVNKQKGVLILDAGIGVKNNPNWFNDEISKSKIFIQSQKNKNKFDGNLIGAVWPGAAVFPDFFNPATADYWAKGLKSLFDKSEFDGIWLDMNEVTSFCKDNAGECPDDAPQPTIADPNQNDWTPIFNPEAPNSKTLQN